MVPRIEQLSAKKLVGFHMSMSLADNKTGQLWKQFMTRKKEISAPLSEDKFSVQFYAPGLDFRSFGPQVVFVKWAAMEIAETGKIPEGMDSCILPGGSYAVFVHKGPASGFHATWLYIFTQWLPQSGYELDDRPHFEVLGEKYRNEHPESEEEVWIPVRKRGKNREK